MSDRILHRQGHLSNSFCTANHTFAEDAVTVLCIFFPLSPLSTAMSCNSVSIVCWVRSSRVDQKAQIKGATVSNRGLNDVCI